MNDSTTLRSTMVTPRSSTLLTPRSSTLATPLRTPIVEKRLHFVTSLRTETLVSLGVLGAAALSLAVFTVLVLVRVGTAPGSAYYLAGLLVADVVLFVAFGAYKLKGLVLDPLDEIVAATEAIAGGDLTRRAPRGSTTELQRLADSVNHMTSRLLEEQAQRSHLEKVASVGRLAAGVAHEIGNPLGAINGYAHLLRGAVNGNAELRETLDGIDRESARIDRIMRGMLEYARPRRRAAQDVDLNACTHRVLELLQAQGVLRGLDLRLDLASQLPPLTGDIHEMDQVLVNLLLNAADAVAGGGSVSVVTQVVPFDDVREGKDHRSREPGHVADTPNQSARVRAWLTGVGSPEQVIKVVVADSGPGIPWSDSERVFDPFFTTKDPGKGTGLGLAVVSRIVESFGGAVWVRPAREGGAAFTMLFPVAPRAASDAPTSSTADERAR